MTENAPIPDRRRQHFERRLRLDATTVRQGRIGLAHAREELADHPAWSPHPKRTD